MKTLKSNFKLSFDVAKWKKKKISLQRIILSIFLLVLVLAGVLPGYLQGGKWSWLDLAKNENQPQLLHIKAKGLEIPGWRIESQGKVQIGDKKWLIQEMVNKDQKFTLLLFPQSYYLNMPGVEWTDLNSINVNGVYCQFKLYDLMNANSQSIGIESESAPISQLLEQGKLSKNNLENLIQKLPESCQGNFQVLAKNQQAAIIMTENSKDWKTDSRQKLTVALQSGQKVEAFFLRGRNKQQTFAVLQWYAWESGGNFAAKKWFVTDLWAQLHKHRASWIAVSVLIPIKILGNIETVKPLAESIVKEVQTTITKNLLVN
jgi:hypothetical protein